MRLFAFDIATNNPINEIGSGSTLSNSDLGLFTIQAIPQDPNATGSVLFYLNGEQFTDNTAPFTLDTGVQLSALDLAAGQYELVAIAFSGADGTGAVVDRTSATFDVTGTPASAGGYNPDANLNPEEKSDFNVEAEAEAEAESEAEVGLATGLAGAVSASAANASAFGSNAATQTLVSGSVSIALDGANENERAEVAPIASAGQSGEGSLGSVAGENSTEDTVGIALISAEAEAESEVEAEVEVIAGLGAAAASASLSAAAAATGADVFLRSSGDAGVVAQETATAINGATSTSSSVSDTMFSGVAPDPADDGVPAGTDTGTVVSSSEGPSSGEIDSGVRADADPAEQQTDTEAEVEVESEAEAEAAVAAGAAVAAASGGTAVAAAGDFVAVDAETAIGTSTATSVADLNDNAAMSQLFTAAGGIGLRTNIVSADLTATGYTLIFDDVVSPTPASDPSPLVSPTPENENVIPGTGRYEAESEVEAEAEVEAEVANNAAALSLVATGGAGSTAIGATSLVSASVSGSTQTEGMMGVLTGANDVVESSSFRSDNDQARTEDLYLDRVTINGNRDTPVAEAEAEAEATAELNLSDPSFALVTESEGLGNASSASVVQIGGYQSAILGTTSEGVQHVTGDRNLDDDAETRVREGNSVGTDEVATTVGNLEVENEAEAEVEVEVEIGFNSAAAGAAAVAAQAQNAIVPSTAEAATATSSSTSVFDTGENAFGNVDLPGPEPLGARGEFPLPNINPYDIIYEVETEAEAEAEVGYNAGAAAAAAGAAGYDNIQADIATFATTNSAASAAAAGAFTEVIISVPAEGEAGIVYAYARAWDPEGRGVAVAVAVAGVPTIGGLDNEAEREAEGLFEAVVEVSVYTASYNPNDISYLFDLQAKGSAAAGADAESEGVDSRFESETEVEAEAEAEAGYGVAGAAAGAAVVGFGSSGVDIDGNATAVVADSVTRTGAVDINFGKVLNATANNTVITGTDGIDLIIGSTGADKLFGGAGGDRLVGGLGADRLTGGTGNDNIFGGVGNDFLVGGSGSDFISGGAGVDTANLSAINVSNYTFFQDGQGVTFARNVNNGATDILVDVEFIKTSDGLLATSSIDNFAGLKFVASNPELIEQFQNRGLTPAQISDAAASIYAASAPGQFNDPTFSGADYLAENPELQAMGINTPTEATLYYINTGYDAEASTIDPAARMLSSNYAAEVEEDAFVFAADQTLVEANSIDVAAATMNEQSTTLRKGLFDTNNVDNTSPSDQDLVTVIDAPVFEFA